MAEVFLIHGHAIQNFCIDLFVFDINQVHLFSDTLHSSFRTEGGNISTDETVGFAGNCLRINVLIEFHVTSMNAENFKTTILVGNTDINFPVEAPETTQSGIDCIWAVGTTDDDN